MGLEPMGYTAANRRTIKLMVEQAAPLFEDGSAPMFMNMATAVIEVTVGKLFYAIAPIGDPNAGKKRLFLRVNTAPYYEDQGDAAAPGSQAQIDAAAALNQAAVEAVEARQDDVEFTLSGALSSSSYRPTPADGADLPIDTYFLAPNASDDDAVWVYQRVATAPGYEAISKQAVKADNVTDTPTRVSMTVGERARLKNLDARVRDYASEEILAAIVDKDYRRSWLEARTVDGGPTEYAMAMVLDRLDELTDIVAKLSATSFVEAPGMLAALTDNVGRYTDLAVRATDGQFADFVIERLAPRLAPYLPSGDASILSSDRYVRGAEVLPVTTDMSRIAGWGSSSIFYLAPFLTDMAAGLEAGAGHAAPSYYSGGKGGEWSTHTFARLGSRPALLTVSGGSIPVSGGVTVTASNMAPSGSMQAFSGTLAGVAGTLSSTADTLTFTRSSAGSAVAVAADTPFIPSIGPTYRDAVTILWAGKNDLSNGAAAVDVIANTDQAFDWLSPFIRRVLVIGHFVDTGVSSGSGFRTRMAAVNAAHAARYGNRYIDVSGYITSAQVWVDTGITPTSDDLAQQALGNKPPSLSIDAGHFNDIGEQALIDFLIKPRVIQLGWYNTRLA